MEVVPNQTIDHKESGSPPAYSNAPASQQHPQHTNSYYGNQIQPDHQTYSQPMNPNPVSPQPTGQSYYAGSPPPQQQSAFATPQHQSSPPSMQHQQSPPPMQQSRMGPPGVQGGQGANLAAQPIALLTSAPAPVHCPSCGATSITRTQFVTGMTTHAWAAGLCLVFCFGCIPYCVSGTKDVEQKCGNCGVLLGTWHRSGRFEQHMFPTQAQQAQQQVPMQPMQQAYYGAPPQHQGSYQ